MNRRALSQICGMTLAKSKRTGISVLSLRQGAAGGTGNFEPGSALVRGILVYCADYHCSHSVALSADRWPDNERLSEIEPQFVCMACGRRGADVRPDFNWNAPASPAMGYR